MFLLVINFGHIYGPIEKLEALLPPHPHAV